MVLALAWPGLALCQERQNQFNGQVGVMLAHNQASQGEVSRNHTDMLTAVGLRTQHETQMGGLVARGLVQIMIRGGGSWEPQELNVGLENEAYGVDLGRMFPGTAQVGKHYLDRNVDASPFVGEPTDSGDFLRLRARQLDLSALLGTANRSDSDEGDYTRETLGLYWSGQPASLIVKLALIQMRDKVDPETNPAGMGGTYDGRSDNVQALGLGKKIDQVQVSLNAERRAASSGHAQADRWDRATDQLIFDWRITDHSGLSLILSQQGTDKKSPRQGTDLREDRQRTDLSWRYDHLDTWYFLMASQDGNKTEGAEASSRSQLAVVAIHNF